MNIVSLKDKSKRGLLLLFLVLYVVSPIDVIPDVPPVGWIDDVLVTLAGIIYLIVTGHKEGNYIKSLFGTLKCLVVVGVFLIALLLILLIVLTVSFIK